MQVLVKTIQGNTTLVDINPATDRLIDLYFRIQQDVEKIIGQDMVIFVYKAGKCLNPLVLSDSRTIGSLHWRHGSMLQCMLPIRGGKGGFGSNLKAAGKHNLVDNYDACRDLQGRRLRHKSAEEKLEKWKAESRERDLEKIALNHLKEVTRKRKPDLGKDEVETVKKVTKTSLRSVKGAVAHALAKGCPTGSSQVSSKKAKLSIFDDPEEGEDSSDIESEEGS